MKKMERTKHDFAARLRASIIKSCRMALMVFAAMLALPLYAAKYSTLIPGYPTIVVRGDMIHIADWYGNVDTTLNITNQMDIYQLYRYMNSSESGLSLEELACYNESDMGIVGRQIWSMNARYQSTVVGLINSQELFTFGISLWQAIDLHEELPTLNLLPNSQQCARESWDLWTRPNDFATARVSALPLFADVRVPQNCVSAEVYEGFLSWAETIGQSYDSIMRSEHTWDSFVLGADRLFAHEPKIELANLDMLSGGIDIGAIIMSVVVRDGEDVAAVSSEKVAAMFEATSDLRDWNGVAKLSPNAEPVTTGTTSTVRIKVRPGDGTAPCAFLRLKGM